MTDPAAGWYPDPGGSGGHRYWNGHEWTDHIAPLPGSPPPGQPSAPAAQPQGAAMQQPPAPQPAPAPQPPATVAQDSPPPTADDAATRVLPSPPAAPPFAAPPPPPPAQAGPYGWSAAPPGMNRVAAGTYDRLGPDGQVLAGWWRRCLGLLLDGLLISFLSVLIVAAIGAVNGGFGEVFDGRVWQDLLAKAEANPGYQPTQQELSQLFGPGLGPLLSWLFLVSLILGAINGVLLVMLSGQTVCDRIVGTRKVTTGRHVPGFGPALLRWLIPTVLVALQVLPVIGVAALAAWILDYLWPLWDPRRQALHDKAAHTYVERSALAGAPNR